MYIVLLIYLCYIHTKIRWLIIQIGFASSGGDVSARLDIIIQNIYIIAWGVLCSGLELVVREGGEPRECGATGISAVSVF